jgi:hypothetical protein
MIVRCVLAAVLVLLFSGAAAAQTDFGADPARYLKLDWKAAPAGAQTAVWGHVYNDFGLPARDIQLLVQALDEAGRPVAHTITWVPFVLAPGTTASFEARVPAAASYKVSVASFSWAYKDDLDFGIRRRRW